MAARQTITVCGALRRVAKCPGRRSGSIFRPRELVKPHSPYPPPNQQHPHARSFLQPAKLDIEIKMKASATSRGFFVLTIHLQKGLIHQTSSIQDFTDTAFINP
jgi:hypothetical protein